MRDVVEAAEVYLNEHARRDRKVLLLITDGNDNASVTPMDRIRRRAEQSDIAIYAVGLMNPREPSKMKRGRDELGDLTEPTGGGARYPWKRSRRMPRPTSSR